MIYLGTLNRGATDRDQGEWELVGPSLVLLGLFVLCVNKSFRCVSTQLHSQSCWQVLSTAKLSARVCVVSSLRGLGFGKCLYVSLQM